MLSILEADFLPRRALPRDYGITHDHNKTAEGQPCQFVHRERTGTSGEPVAFVQDDRAGRSRQWRIVTDRVINGVLWSFARSRSLAPRAHQPQ